MSRWARDWGPALLWAAVIFLLSSRSTVPGPRLFPGADKAAHFAAYALLGALLARGGARRGTAAWALVLLGWLYGASDEVHQAFVPGRDADPLDWLADAGGVLAGVLGVRRWTAGRAAPRRP